jgi:hypothetical protein
VNFHSVFNCLGQAFNLFSYRIVGRVSRAVVCHTGVRL